MFGSVFRPLGKIVCFFGKSSRYRAFRSSTPFFHNKHTWLVGYYYKFVTLIFSRTILFFNLYSRSLFISIRAIEILKKKGQKFKKKRARSGSGWRRASVGVDVEARGDVCSWVRKYRWGCGWEELVKEFLGISSMLTK